MKAGNLEGRELVFFDNINSSIESSVLAAAVTSEYFSGRILGQSKTAMVKSTILYFMTANNPLMSGEIARRSITSRQIANCSKPWERDVNSFNHPDLRGYVRENSDRIFSAYISLCLNWIDAGAPTWTGKPLGSFEAYCRTIGGILEYAGIPGFLENRDRVFQESDSETIIFSEFLSEWWDQFSNSPVKVSMLYPIALKIDGMDLGEKSQQGQRINLGRLISKRRDAILDQFRVRSAGVKHKTQHWKLERVEEELPQRGGDNGDRRGYSPYPVREKHDFHSSISAEIPPYLPHPPQDDESLDIYDQEETTSEMPIF